MFMFDNSIGRVGNDVFHGLQTKAAAQEAAASVKSQSTDNPLEALKNKINEASVTNDSPQVQLDKVCAADGLCGMDVARHP